MDIFELLLILIVVLIVVGPQRLPEAMRGAGKLVRELRAASNSVMRELSDALEEEPTRPKPVAAARATPNDVHSADPPAQT
ncbi:MAG: Sec-independent protein translocase subunit TatA/TatB [Candidatus Binataceae bacterium]